MSDYISGTSYKFEKALKEYVPTAVPEILLMIGNGGYTGIVADAKILNIEKMEDVEAAYGKKSDLYHMAKKVLNVASSEIKLQTLALPLSATTKATCDLSITKLGTVEAGSFYLYVNEKKNLITVEAGDSPNKIGTQIKTKIDADIESLVSVTLTTLSADEETITFTSNLNGALGNQLRVTINPKEMGDKSPSGLLVAGAGFLENGAGELVFTDVEQRIDKSITTICLSSSLQADLTFFKTLWDFKSNKKVNEIFKGIATTKDDDAATILNDLNTAGLCFIKCPDVLEPDFLVNTEAALHVAVQSATNFTLPFKTTPLNLTSLEITKEISKEEQSNLADDGISAILYKNKAFQFGDLLTTLLLDSVGQNTEEWKYLNDINDANFIEYNIIQLAESERFSKKRVVTDKAYLTAVNKGALISPALYKNAIAISIFKRAEAEGLFYTPEEVYESLNVEIDAANKGKFNVKFKINGTWALRQVSFIHQREV